jgi:hypothetical protein
VVVLGNSTNTPSTETESDEEMPCEAHLSEGGPSPNYTNQGIAW